MIVAATLFGVELADVAQRDIHSLELAIMTATWRPSRPCRAKEVVLARLLPGQRVAPLDGDPIQENVLVCADRALPRHGSDRHTGHLGAHGETHGYWAAGTGPVRVPQAGIAQPSGVVELDHAAHGDLSAPGTCV